MNLLKAFHRSLELASIYNLTQKFGADTLSCYRKLIERNVKLSENGRILDIGCGTGQFAAAFGGTYFGTDVNPDYMRIAQATHRGIFCVSDCAQLCFDKGTFDHAITIAVLHHVPDRSVLAMIAEAFRVCRSNSVFHIVEAIYPENRKNLFKWLLFRLDRGQHQRSLRTLRSLIEASFEIAHCDLERGLLHDTCYLAVRPRSMESSESHRPG